MCHLLKVQLFAITWTVDLQAPLSIGFPRQDYSSGLPFPTPGDLPNPGIKPRSLKSPVLAGRWEGHNIDIFYCLKIRKY